MSPAAYTAPAADQWGNAGRNNFSGPGLGNLDFSIFRKFSVTEKINVEFRAEPPTDFARDPHRVSLLRLSHSSRRLYVVFHHQGAAVVAALLRES